MKKTILYFSTFIALFLISCEGPMGPPGLDGFDGQDGQDGQSAELAKVIDIQGSFTPNNDYLISYSFDNSIEVFETDVVLVYLLWEQVEDANGDPVDVWRLMPQTRIIDQGLLQYNYDHTFFDVNIFLEANFDLANLLPGDTNNQVFRIAVIPAETTGKSSIDKTNIAEVMSYLGVTENEVKRIKAN